jgi:hypothetical protein
MKMNHTVVAAILMGLYDGTLRNPRSITNSNRLHTDRARRGSPEERERLDAAAAKRARRAARAFK